MEEILYLINLYDYYGELLTIKQQQYFEQYYFDNLTLSEISENNDVSRNAVHKTIKEIEKKLYYYENILKLYKKSNNIKALIIDLDEELKTKISKYI